MASFDFNCPIELKKEISKVFGVTIENVDAMISEYKKMVTDIPYQYLAHIIRTMETYIRKHKGFEFFRITCSPMKEKIETIKGHACATYHEPHSFDIVYDSTMDDLQTRVCIAHELGHLFLVVMSELDHKRKYEPLSTVYRALIMLHKYQSKRRKKHKSESDVLADFSLMLNKEHSRINVSDKERKI